MTSPLLQEAAKVLYECDPLLDTYDKDGKAVLRPFEGLPEAAKKYYADDAAKLIRWLLTREPTEGMVEAGLASGPELEGGLDAIAIYRAMNAALLKEVEG